MRGFDTVKEAFIEHYSKMSKDRIVADVRKSLEDMADMNSTGKSFGSMMVRWLVANAKRYPMASTNGSKGGKAKSKKAVPPSVSRSIMSCNGRFPRDKESVTGFAMVSGIDVDDAGECWEATKERGFKTADGQEIINWKAYVYKWCETRKNNREGLKNED